jgi:hypothetical protein
MPYIKQEDCKTAEELNSAITGLIQSYITKKGLNYQHINDVIGALEIAKVEFQKKVVNPYENGDCYNLENKVLLEEIDG